MRSEPEMGASAVGLLLGVLGVAVAIARELRRSELRSRARTIADFLITTVAWPFYLPTVLAQSPPPPRAPSRRSRPEERRLDRAEEALSATLGALDGVALEALRGELPRMRSLASGLRPWVARLVELEAELARPESDRAQLEAARRELESRGLPEDDPRLLSVCARASSLQHLAALHVRAAAELERALLELEELITELRVLRFAGPRPQDGSIERLRQLTGNVAAVRDALLAAQ